MRTNTSAHRHIGTQTHLHTGTLAHRHIGTQAHWHTGTLAHRHICTQAHWHTGTLAHLHTGTLAHRHIGTQAHWHICTQAHLHTGTLAHRCHVPCTVSTAHQVRSLWLPRHHHLQIKWGQLSQQPKRLDDIHGFKTFSKPSACKCNTFLTRQCITAYANEARETTN